MVLQSNPFYRAILRTMVRSTYLVLFGALLGLLLSACSENPGKAGRTTEALSCNPTGECEADLLCNGEAECVQPAECHDTCITVAHECGLVCGENCGTCEPGNICQNGACVCEPRCDGTFTGDDGCGGWCDCPAGTANDRNNQCIETSSCTDTCESAEWNCGYICGKPCGDCGTNEMCALGHCREGVSCSTCSLRLYVIDRKRSGSRLTQVTIAVEYQPKIDEARPRMMDLRLSVDAAATMSNVEKGSALSQAQKHLYVDPASGLPYRQREDGTFQFLAYAMDNTHRVAPGRILTLQFTMDVSEPVRFSLVRREETFAPPAADQALMADEYEKALVVWP